MKIPKDWEKNICENLAENRFKGISNDLLNYEKKQYIKMCKVVREISQDNLILLSFTEHQQFKKDMHKKFNELIDMEI